MENTNEYISTVVNKINLSMLNDDEIKKSINLLSSNPVDNMKFLKNNVGMFSGAGSDVIWKRFVDNNPTDDATIVKLLNIIKNKRIYDSSLTSGMAGVGQSLLLSGRNDLCSVLNEINDVLIDIVRDKIKLILSSTSNHVSDFDWMYGLSGVLKYAINLYKSSYVSKKCVELIELIIDFYYAKYFKKNLDFFNAWYIPSENFMTLVDKNDYPYGGVNPSMSHGIAGVLNSICDCYSINIKISKCKLMIESLYDYLLSNKVLCEGIYTWPFMITSKGEHTKSIRRFDSWCYGAPGIYMSLMKSTIIMDKHVEGERIIEYLHDILIDPRGINTPGICHGYSGILMISLTLNTYSKRDIFSNKELQNMSRNIMGYYNCNNDLGFVDKMIISDRSVNSIDLGILTGVKGISSVLSWYLEYCSCKRVIPEWVDIFGMNLSNI